ncbi:hypothetical protein [Curtobacterium flaccumfaciens]|uniref:DUF7507 domain-containing protein n=1 Tax=Curtobacterium flaccumfaciens TaxID=2035 RepID=UPI00159B2749|nr:hypothetical protein [Curtobacterium flaccumfaciens]QKS86555.1 hypothetical protein FK523_02700 [Curtobacterium flaccumfaciens pv. flaccumfaciens]
MTSPQGAGAWKRWSALLAVAATITAGLSLTAAGAHAEVQLPRAGAVPPAADGAKSASGSAPKVIFSEGFEQGVGSSTMLLTQYVGLNGVKYRADPEWVSAAQCNGIITNFVAPTAPTCHSDQGSVGELAYVLGQINGGDPRTNHAVSAWTWDRSTTPGSVQVGSVRDVPIGGTDRFISFGVDAAASACSGFAHPSLVFSLVDGGRERPVTDSAIDPCTTAGTKAYSVGGHQVRGGHFVADAALLVSNDAVGWTMRNRQGNYSGNDGAIDGVTMYDATPRLANAFDGTTPFVGESARLTFTVQNTSENGAKSGWSFSDTLPDHLVLSADPRAETTCAQADVAADGGSSTVTVSGGLAAGAASCTVTVDVTSTTAGTYSIGADTVNDHTGIDLPETASITFLPEQNELVVEDRPVLSGGSDAVADLGEGIAFAQRVTNAGALPVTGLEVEGTNGVVVCEADDLAPGASTDCATPSRRVVQADIDRGHIDDEVGATARSPLGAEVEATDSASQPTTASAPAIGTSVSATLEATDMPVPGLPVELRLSATNIGNVTLHDVAVTMPGLVGAGVSCPQDELAPTDSVECTVPDHALTQADIDRGSIVFSDRAVGIAPDGRTVNAEDDDTVTLPQVPSVSTSITANLASSEHDVPAAGDSVEVAVTVTNTGNTTLKEIGAAIQGRPELAVTCSAEPLVPGGSTSCTVPDHALTQADIDRGSIVFSDRAVGVAPDGRTVNAEDDDTVTLPQVPSVSTSITANLASSEHDVPAAGDSVEVAVTVTNTGNTTLKEIGAAIQDRPELAVTCSAEPLVPGGSTSCTVPDHALTQDDIELGAVEFIETASGKDPNGEPVTANDSVTVGLDARSALFLEGAWTPSDGEPVRSGDEIASTYEVTNTSNLVARSISVQSVETGVITCRAEELAPGEQTACTASTPRQVTDGDVTVGHVLFEAVATGSVAREDGAVGPRGAVEVRSNEVEARFVVAPLPADLAYTGADIARTAAIALGVFGSGAVMLLAVWLRRRRREV